MAHSYGWKPSPPDIRDHRYSVAPEILRALPASVDQSQPELGSPWTPTWNQLQLGSCGPFGVAQDIVFSALRQQGLSSVPMPSRLFIYWVTRLLMGTVGQDSGVDNRTLLKALNKYGWCDESLWPYDISKFTIQPPAQCFTQAAGRKIIQYLAVAQNLEQMKGCIASGDPFLFGFTVYDSFESAETTRTGIVPMPQTSEQVLGGHDVLFIGYDDATQRFKFRNQWGAWGDGGYGYMPYAFATHPQLASDFWTVRQSALPIPAPPAVNTVSLRIPATLTPGKAYFFQEVV